MQTYTIKVPATSANLGSGFDTLGMALDLYNTIEITPLDGYGHLDFTVLGLGADSGMDNPDNLIYQAYCYPFLKKNLPVPSIKIIAHNTIPFARGLGSSSTAIVSGLLASQVVSNFSYTMDELILLATELDHHPDNVAPALLGGIVISRYLEDGVVTKKINPPKALKTLAIIPDYELSTKKAREVLPLSYEKDKVIANLGAISFLIAGLITEDLSLLRQGLKDTLHEPYRQVLIKELLPLRVESEKLGAYGTIISGAGSTLLVFYDENFFLEDFKKYCQNTFKNAIVVDVHPIQTGAQIFKDESELKICP